MIKKEVLEIRKLFRMEDCCLTRICGCYVEMRAAIIHRHCPDIHPRW